MNYKPVLLSGSDPTGVLFFNGKSYLRGINPDKSDEIRHMFQDGFIDELVSRRFIPKTRILDENIPDELKEYDLVLEHESIYPIFYPREWSFEMVKMAALSFLEISKVAFSYGYYCKDCHLFNVVFDGTHPLWVDIGSFLKTSKKTFPFPLSSFYLSILYPLSAWKNGAEFIGSSLLSSPTDVEEIEILLYKYPFLRVMPKLHRIFLFFIKALHNLKAKDKFFVKIILSDLKRKLIRMNYRKSSRWNDYQDEYMDKHGNFIKDDRFDRITEFLQQYSPSSILELAGNSGILSELILKRIGNVKIICTDYDSLAIDSMFRRIKKRKIYNFFCGKLNFMVTRSSSSEITPSERLKSDCVLALAVTHHLSLTQGYSFDLIFENIKLYSRRLVFIEYMPLGLWNGKTALPLPKWYNQEEFERAFNKHFEILKIEKLDENRILFIGELK